MARLLFGPAGPERDPRVPGEWVDLSAMIQGPVRLELDPIAQVVADLVRQFDPGGYRLQCPVAGCGWGLLVPRMEMDPEHLAGDSWTVRVEAVPREDLELILRTHLDLHAVLAETNVLDTPLPQPPRWDQQEWCDGGTCEHPRCLDLLQRSGDEL